MKYIIKNSPTPVMDYRNLVLEMIQIINEHLETNNEIIEIDCSEITFSRSALDEVYKQLICENSPLSKKIRLVNTDEDFALKLKAVKKTQNFKKHIIKFDKQNCLFKANSSTIQRS